MNNYVKYLKSTHWLDLRKRYFQSRNTNHKCSVCRTTNNLHLHHRTYKRKGKERLKDLIALCETHHKEFHTLFGFGHVPNLLAKTNQFLKMYRRGKGREPLSKDALKEKKEYLKSRKIIHKKQEELDEEYKRSVEFDKFMYPENSS